MAIAVVNLGDSLPGAIDAPDFESSTDATSYANASWTPPTADNCIILLWVYNNKATTVGVAGTVTGNGLTWTLQASNAVDPGAQTHRLTLYAAISTGTASAGQTTVDYAGVTQSGIIMMFQQVTGVDLTGALAGTIIQQPSNTTSSANSLAANLSAASDAANRFMAGVGHGANEGADAELGWDELDDWGGASPGRSLLVMWDSDSVADTSPTVSWATAAAAVAISIEVVAAPETSQTYEDSVTIGKVVTESNSPQTDFNPTSALVKITSFSDLANLDIYPDTSLGRITGITDVANLDMQSEMSLGKVAGLSDGATLDISKDIDLSQINGFDPQLQFIVGAIITLAKVNAIDLSVIRTMEVTLGLGKVVTVTIDGSLVTVVSKGFVAVLDFAANPITVMSFRANDSSSSDTASSAVEASSE